MVLSVVVVVLSVPDDVEVDVEPVGDVQPICVPLTVSPTPVLQPSDTVAVLPPLLVGSTFTLVVEPLVVVEMSGLLVDGGAGGGGSWGRMPPVFGGGAGGGLRRLLLPPVPGEVGPPAGKPALGPLRLLPEPPVLLDDRLNGLRPLPGVIGLKPRLKAGLMPG